VRVARKPWFWIAVAAAAAAAWLILRPPPVEDRAPKCREVVRAVEGWAARRGLKPDGGGARSEVRTEHRVRWLHAERGYWYPPTRSHGTLGKELVGIARARGLAIRVESTAANSLCVDMVFPDGRSAVRVRLRLMCFAAIVIDDMGFSLTSARRVVALPCPVTCAIIPFSGHDRAVARLAAASGKEVFIHMPMESPFRVPDVPEYRLILRSGMTRTEIGERVKAALAEIPHAAGINNHEGSLATENAELMGDLMAVLKPCRLVFLDSGTTEKTVAWSAARDAGLRWERRNVFLDAEYARPSGPKGAPRDPAAVEAEFSRLIALARKRGRAIAIGHNQFAETLDVLERRIPEAQRQGVEFVFASWLALGGK